MARQCDLLNVSVFNEQRCEEKLENDISFFLLRWLKLNSKDKQSI